MLAVLFSVALVLGPFGGPHHTMVGRTRRWGPGDDSGGDGDRALRRKLRQVLAASADRRRLQTPGVPCTGVSPPPHGGWGSCPVNGTLAHGASCTVTCPYGYTAVAAAAAAAAVAAPVPSPVSSASGSWSDNGQQLGPSAPPPPWSVVGAPAVHPSCAGGNLTMSVACRPNGCAAGTVTRSHHGFSSCPTATPNGTLLLHLGAAAASTGLHTCASGCSQGYALAAVVLSRPLGAAGMLLSEVVCEPAPCALAAPPANGTWGTCGRSLAHGATCRMTCGFGFALTGSQPFCSFGGLHSSVVCTHVPDRCAGIPGFVMCGDGSCVHRSSDSTCCLLNSDCRGHGLCLPNGPGGASVCNCGAGYSGAYCSVPDTCSGVVAPAHGSLGDCPGDGRLAHGQSCSLACMAGYSVASGSQHPSCSAGTVSSSVVCEPANCTVLLPSMTNASLTNASLTNASLTNASLTHASLGHCPVNGTLAHGASCTVPCNSGFSAPPIVCSFGGALNATCLPNVNCTGAWSTCTASCDMKIYTVTTSQSGNGSACTASNGTAALCMAGDGLCTGVCASNSDCNGHGICQSSTSRCQCSAGYGGGLCSVPNDCSGVVAPAHGSLGDCLGDGRLAHGQSCSLACMAGYSVASGSQHPSCSAGTVSSSVVCEPANCTGLSAPSYGSLGNCSSDGTLAHGANCSMSCNAGTILKSGATQQIIFCAFGNSSTAAACVPIPCTYLSPSLHGETTTFPRPNTSIPPGVNCTHRCRAGYTLTDARHVCSTGSVLSRLTCAGNTCSGISAPAGGQLGTCSRDGLLAHGQNCSLECNAGFTLSGTQPSCHAGNLTAAVVCTGNGCSDLPIPTHGFLGNCPSNRFLQHQQSCNLACGAGYTFRGQQPTCYAGNLSVSPVCVPNNCTGNTLIPVRGRPGQCAEDGTLTHGTSCTFECEHGYSPSGGQPQCSVGVLTSSASCAPDDCRNLQIPTNGRRGSCSANGTLSHGHQCHFTCSAGYALQGGQPSCFAGKLFSGGQPDSVSAQSACCRPLVTGMCAANNDPTEDVVCPAGQGPKVGWYRPLGSVLSFVTQICCGAISGMCSGNVAVSENVMCRNGTSLRPGSDAIFRDINGADSVQHTCCVEQINATGVGMCVHNINASEDVNCSIIGFVPKANASAIPRGSGSLVTLVDRCCQAVTGKCSGNTDAAEDVSCPSGQFLPPGAHTISRGGLEARCVPHNCSNIRPPANGSMGSCPADGTLVHGLRCSFSCNPGYTARGLGPYCHLGRVTAATTCVPDVDCIGGWSECSETCSDKMFTVVVPQSGSGLPCPVPHGRTAVCNSGDGLCTGACETGCSCGSGVCGSTRYIVPTGCESVTGFSACNGSSWCMPRHLCPMHNTSRSTNSSVLLTANQTNFTTVPPMPEYIRRCECHSGYSGGFCLTPPSTDCIASWSECTAECLHATYNISVPANGTGNVCTHAHGETKTCSPGDGNCTGYCQLSKCVAPDGTVLPHIADRQSCEDVVTIIASSGSWDGYGNVWVPSACGAHGKCNVSTAFCQCTDNFTGAFCNRPPVCSSDNHCVNGTCVDGSCKCNFGFSGYNCSIEPCGGCGYNGACARDHVGAYNCNCTSGYSGQHCEHADCVPHSSGAGAGAICTCDCGYVGRPLWNDGLQKYDGRCTAIPCPAFSSGKGAGLKCTCNTGFVGNIVWNHTGQHYVGQCVPPINLFAAYSDVTGLVCLLNAVPIPIPLDLCGDCGSHGACDHVAGSCRCVGGYKGPYCTVPPDCTGVMAPANGHFGKCLLDGTLQHGTSCELACCSGYTVTGMQPSCDSGIISGSVRCVKDVDCVGKWSNCTADCSTRVFTVHTNRSGSGSACPYLNGSVA
eukprot:COSAG01_NODE_3351_length_6223_cov_4.553622_1_plen_1854_part_01